MRNSLAILMVATLTACGGGSSDSTLASTNTSGAGTTGTTGTANNSGGTGTTNIGSSDANLLKLVASQVIISDVAFTMAQYQSSTGVGPAGRSDFSPVLSFGLRPQSNNRPTATGTVFHTSLLLSMKQRAADVLPGQVAQVFQFELPQVDMVLSADHDVVKVSFPEGAQAFAYYTDPFNETVTGSSAALSADLIQFQPIPDDTTSNLLSFSIDPLMRDIINNSAPSAHSIWNGIAPMHGTFDTSIVIGGTSMETDAFVPIPSTTLAFAGASLPPVTGAVLSGGVIVAPD